MIKRSLQKKITDAAGVFPVIAITGPRQAGKTTLAQYLFPEHEYVSLEDLDIRDFAQTDPRGFFKKYTKAILDEIQRVPELVSYLQGITDKAKQSGQYIITGSQQILLLENISQSLAGRVAIFHLLPFSIAELLGRDAYDFGNIPTQIESPGIKEDVNSVMFSGFYPRIYDQHIDPQLWLASYYRAYVERDVRTIINVGDLSTFQRFVKLCAARCGQILNLSGLAADCGVSHTTAGKWLSILEICSIIYLLKPHYQNFSKRLVKSPKLYFFDTGLLCYLLGIHNVSDIDIHPLRGNLFENLVISDIYKNFNNYYLDVPLYYWRDHTGHEIDLIIDMGNTLLPVEIKSSYTISSDFIRNIDFWRNLKGNKNREAFLIYAGDDSYYREETHILSWRNL